MSNNDRIDIRKGIEDLQSALRMRSVREWLASDALQPPWDIEELVNGLDERVYTQVPKPWPLHPRELAECVRDQVLIHAGSSFDLNLERLLSAVRSRCDYRTTDFSLILPIPILRWAKEEWPINLVTLPSGVRLVWQALRREHHTVDPGANELKEVQAHFRLQGFHSTAAAKQVAESVSELLGSLCPIMFNYGLFNTAGRLNNLLGPEYEYGGSADSVESHLAAANDTDYPEYNEQIIELSSDVRGVMDSVADLIKYAYLPPLGKRDAGTFERRLANAAELVVCAFKLSAPSVRLALYVAAIEALVCSKEEGIAEEMSHNCATLLLSDATVRIEAIKAVKKLYGIRSKALHGDRFAATPSDVACAQELCGAVLTAVIEWRRFHERMESTGSRQSFLDAVSEAKITGRPLTGVPERLEAGLAWVSRMEASGNRRQP
jgi:hypothetical protein